MPSDSLPLLVCFGFVFFLVPVIICIVLGVQFSALRQRVQYLEGRLADMARELYQRPRAAPPAPETPPAVSLAQRPLDLQKLAATAPHPASTQSTTPVTPPAPPVQPAPVASRGSETSSHLLEKLAQVREKEHLATPLEALAAARSTPPASAPPVTPPSPTPEVPPLTSAPIHKPTVADVPHTTAAHLPPTQPPARTASPQAAPRPEAKRRGLDFYLVAAFIVVGAISIALAVIFLVKMGIDNGYFGPLQRDWAAAIAGVALLGVGQWRRRFEGFWSQGATAAGIVALFATIFAATSVHHFLDPLTGFIFLAVTTAVAVAMSLQNWSGNTGEGGRAKGGILIATLGLVGGFMTPILVNSGHDNVPGLFGYLILLHIGLIFSTRIRGWSILAAASVIFSSLWLMLWVFFKWDPILHPHDGSIFGLFMLSAVGSLVISTVSQPNQWRGGRSGLAAMALTWLAVGLGLLASCLLLGKSHYDNLQWIFFAMLVAGAFVLARLRPIYEGMAWLGSIAVLGMLAAWGWSAQLHGAQVSPEAMLDHVRFQGWLTAFGAATVLGAFACQWKSAAPVRWAALAGLLALSYVGVAYWLIPTAPRPDEWAYLPLLVAAILAALMVPIVLRRATIVTGDECLAVYGHAILALLLIAPPMGLHGGALTAAWAAILPLTALAIWRLRLPGLMPGLLAAIVVVSIRALMIGSVFDADGPGRNLFWNPVIWAYGTTLLTMALTAWLLERCEELPDRLRDVIPSPKTIAAMLQVGAAVSAFLLLTLEVRWGFHSGKLDANSALLVERGTFAIGWILLAAAVTWIGRQVQRILLIRCGEVIAILGLVYAVIGLVFIANPLWWQWFGSEDVGPLPVFNLLLYAYGAPAALCGLLAFVLHKCDPENSALAKAAGAAGLILLFAMVSLQVHQGYVGGDLALTHGSRASFLEYATYSIAWMTLGVICLAIARRFNRDLLRRAAILLCSGSLAYAIVFLGFIRSPLFHHESVGTWIVLNQLLFAYGTPILLAAIAACIVHPRATRLLGPWTPENDRAFEGGWSFSAWLGAAILMLLFILVTTEIRQAFQGAYIDTTHITFFERSTYPIAWLALAAAILAVGNTLSTTARRGGLTIAAIGMGFTLAIGVGLFNPLWSGENVGSTLIFNDLLYAYGLPTLLCGLIAWILHRHSPIAAPLARAAATLALFLLLVTVSLEVRQGFQGAYLNIQQMHFLERGTYPVAWFALATLLLLIGHKFNLQIAQRGGLLFAALALGFSVLICTLLMNPLFTHERVGTMPIINGLLYVYGISAAAAAVLAWLLWNRRTWIDAGLNLNAQVCAWISGISSLLLIFVLVTLEVQHMFRGDNLYFGAPPSGNSPGEFATYSIVWALMGIIYLVVGILRRSVLLRWTSLVMMLITIPKVFLFDMPALQNMQRVLSFAGTGISLMALAFVYQRFVFRKPPAPPVPAAPIPDSPPHD